MSLLQRGWESAGHAQRQEPPLLSVPGGGRSASHPLSSSLCHTFAFLLIQNGESPKYVCDQLGHSSIKMTADVCGHMVPPANRQAANRLPALQHGMSRQVGQGWTKSEPEDKRDNVIPSRSAGELSPGSRLSASDKTT